MFVFNKAAEGQISTHQFEITGSTYAPEGEVLAFMLLRVDTCDGYNVPIQLFWHIILACQ